MCGIVGIIGKNRENKDELVHQMAKIIAHRGPDDDGFFVDNFVGLGMRRLSIIDLSTGKQPIWSDDRKQMIFFNGEIYNYKELREELLTKGFKFRTQTDTEVILNMFLAYGVESFKRLRGMFAFCIYDTEKKSMILVRDFFGIKPLYYFVKENKIQAFSSEIKSFGALPDWKPEVNDNAVYNYLSFQYNPLSETFFKNVWKLPPASYMKVDLESGSFDIQKYWSFEISSKSEIGIKEKEMAMTVFDTMEDSVKHHMIADVPVGSFLSGGVDSSIIATMMQKIRGEKSIKTFTVGFDTLTEGKEAVETSDFLGTDHTEIKISAKEYFDILPKAVWHFDEPVGDPSAIGLYFVAREARKHVTVVLSGEGADELFGGYNIYLAPFAYRKISWIPRSFLGGILRIPFEFFGKNYIKRAYQKMEDWYIGNASVFKKNEKNILWKGERQDDFSLENLYTNVKNLSDSAKMQYIDVKTWLIGDILAKADKMTMANSLELRVPFLDIEVSNLATSLSDDLKWKNGKVTKFILREAFKNIIPESTRNRKKLGFPTPIRDWLTADRRDIYEKILSNEYVKTHLNTDYIQKIISDHTSKKSDNSRKIYLLLMLSLWYDTFIKLD